MGRRAPAVGYGITVGLGLATIVGYLFASGAAAPLITSAVSTAYSVAGKEQPGSAKAQPDQQMVASYTYSSSGEGNTYDWSDDTWMDQKTTPEWSTVRGVPAVSGPSQPSVPSRPTVDVPENPHQFFPHNGSSAAAELKLEPMHSCFQQRGPAAQVPTFDVESVKGGATMKWWDLGDPDLQSYAITAVPTGGGKGKVVTINVPAPGGCKYATASMPGLLSGQVYRFWLTATNKSPINGQIYRPSRGTSSSIVIK